MMKSIFVAAFAFVCLGAAPAFAEPAAPALYVVRDADSTLYLYGTIHLRKPGAAWGGPHVDAALADSQEVWTEVVLNDAVEAEMQSAVMQHGMAPADRPLSSWLTEEERTRLDATAQRLGLPPNAMEGMRPWMASMMLVVLPMVQAGFDPNAGVDRAISAWGAANGKTMRGFETVTQQLGFFSGLDDETQRQLLLSAIDDAEEGAALINAMSDAWDRGNFDTLETEMVKLQTEFPAMYEAFFTQRNNAWMETLNAELAGSGVDFVAVGAGHLIGDGGLVAQLRAQGHVVERVSAP